LPGRTAEPASELGVNGSERATCGGVDIPARGRGIDRGGGSLEGSMGKSADDESNDVRFASRIVFFCSAVKAEGKRKKVSDA
jgi:hypothetical protein